MNSGADSIATRDTRGRWPDFLIVGAPKCGTTSLYRYLSQHPQIFMPRNKEPHFFGADLQRPMYVKHEDDYLELFSEALPAQLVGEGSVWYLYSREAAQEIKAKLPNAKIIILLRNPVEVIRSLHGQLVFNGSEDIVDLGAALAAEGSRRLGRQLPAGISFPERLFYREVATFSSQLERWQSLFPPEALRVIVLEEFLANPEEAFRDILNFLEVDSHFETEWEIHNRAKQVRSRTLARILREPPRVLHDAFRQLLPPPVRGRMRAAVSQLNIRRGGPNLDPRLRRELTEEFQPEILKLEKLLDRSLSVWIGQSPPANTTRRVPKR